MEEVTILDLKDKVIIITGASSGIGKEFAIQSAKKGAKLALLARREDKLKDIAYEIGDNIAIIPCDIRNNDEDNIAIAKCIETFGRIDILVNSAGVGYFGTIEKMNMEDLDTIVKTNIYGLLYMVKACIPHLKKSEGMVVNVSSSLSKRALPFLSAYAGTKSMLDALSDGMRMELKKFNIKVTNFCPPETKTEFAANSLREAGLVLAEQERKLASVEEVVKVLVNAIEKEKREVVMGRFLKYMNFFVPKVLDGIFYKAMVERIYKD